MRLEIYYYFIFEDVLRVLNGHKECLKFLQSHLCLLDNASPLQGITKH